MNVLVTGAFGNIGCSSLDELVKRNYKVRCFDVKTKANEKTARRYKNKVEIIWGDLRNQSNVARAVRGQDVVIHLAFVIPKLSVTGVGSEEHPNWARSINVGGTENLIRALQHEDPSPRLLFTSSLHVYGRTQNLPPPRTLADVPHPVEHYAHHKLECEKMIKASGLTWSIFRLGAALPLRLVLDPGMFDVPLRNRIEFIHTRDVGYAIVKALENDGVWGKTLLIGGGPACQLYYADMVDKVLDAMGIGKLPEEAFCNSEFATDWLDTHESQSLLHYQCHTLDDYAHDLANKLGSLRDFIHVMQPLVKRWLLHYSPYLQ